MAVDRSIAVAVKIIAKGKLPGSLVMIRSYLKVWVSPPQRIRKRVLAVYAKPGKRGVALPFF
jgi:hypothetical protein